MTSSVNQLKGVEGTTQAKEAQIILEGGSPNQFATGARTHVFWHRRDLANVTAGEEIRFFNEDQSEYRTNWKRSLPNGELFMLQAVRIGVYAGYQVDGTAEVNGDPFDTNGSAALQAAADRAVLIENGLVSMRVNDREVIQSVYGLENFPQGGGPVGALAGYSTASSVTATAGIITNGEAHNGNAWMVTPQGGYVIAPNEAIDFTIKYNFSRTLADAVVLKVGLFGVYLTASKR